MERILALTVMLGLSVGIADADDKPTGPPSKLTTVSPENDWRLAKQPGAQPQKIGLFTYYPNNGGGFTFLEGKRVEVYSLPYLPTLYQADCVEWVTETTIDGKRTRRALPTRNNLFTIGTSKMHFGSQTVYRAQMKDTLTAGVRQREDVPLGKWSRDTSDGKFRLSLEGEDNETRLKLKSIVPVLERAEHAP